MLPRDMIGKATVDLILLYPALAIGSLFNCNTVYMNSWMYGIYVKMQL